MFLWIRISLCLRRWLKEIVYCFIRNRLLSYFYSRKKINFILIVFFSIVFNEVLCFEILKVNIGHRGAIWLECISYGKAMHPGSSVHVENNAITNM